MILVSSCNSRSSLAVIVALWLRGMMMSQCSQISEILLFIFWPNLLLFANLIANWKGKGVREWEVRGFSFWAQTKPLNGANLHVSSVFTFWTEVLLVNMNPQLPPFLSKTSLKCLDLEGAGYLSHIIFILSIGVGMPETTEKCSNRCHVIQLEKTSLFDSAQCSWWIVSLQS